MNVGDLVMVNLDQSFVQGRIIGIPENRGRALYKVEFADISTSPQWFDAAKCFRVDKPESMLTRVGMSA